MIIRRARFKVTKRDYEVIELVAKAMTNKQIAKALGIEASTVKTHLRKINKILRTRNRVDLAVWYITTLETELFVEK